MSEAEAGANKQPDPTEQFREMRDAYLAIWSKNLIETVNSESYARSNRHDDKGDPNFGRLTLARAFEVSSNIYFANLATRLDPNVFREQLADQFGFSHVPKQPHFDADLSDIGYGQGRMLASPMEMCRLCGTMANGGLALQPRLVTKIDTHFEDPRPLKDKARRPRVLERPPVELQRATSSTTARTIQGYMRRVVTGGTARGVFDNLPFAVAGKTGTAQNRQYDSQPHSWFVGFAPCYKPEIVVAVLWEEGVHGQFAAPIARDVMKAYFDKKVHPVEQTRLESKDPLPGRDHEAAVPPPALHP